LAGKVRSKDKEDVPKEISRTKPRSIPKIVADNEQQTDLTGKRVSFGRS
ncbi:hypothetical protein B0I27_106232, partial [Arcticibacter pallidicorallinus]